MQRVACMDTLAGELFRKDSNEMLPRYLRKQICKRRHTYENLQKQDFLCILNSESIPLEEQEKIHKLRWEAFRANRANEEQLEATKELLLDENFSEDIAYEEQLCKHYTELENMHEAFMENAKALLYLTKPYKRGPLRRWLTPAF